MKPPLLLPQSRGAVGDPRPTDAVDVDIKFDGGSRTAPRGRAMGDAVGKLAVFERQARPVSVYRWELPESGR